MSDTPAPSGGGQGKRFITTTVEVEGRVESKVVELPESEPAAWDANAALRIVGQPVTRHDAREKVTGRARYTADVQLPGMLFAAFVRVDAAHARVSAIDTAPALDIPGVVDVLVAADLPRTIKVGGVKLFDSTIQFAGQPIAAVCAESREAAERGAAAVRVDYEVLPPVLTFDESVSSGAPKVRGANNLLSGFPQLVERGNVDAALRDANVVIRREYTTSGQLHSAMEPHGAVAEWDGDVVTIWESTQGVFRIRDEVASTLALARSRVRVVKDYMGGGFGAKSHAGAHTYVAVLFARRLQRPVRCVLSRAEEQTVTGHRPASQIAVTLGAKSDGALVAIDVDVRIALGIGGWAMSAAAIFRELYRCANVRTRESLAFTHLQEMQAFRAPGHVEGAFALERAMDVMANALGMDRLAFRLRNLADRDQDKDRAWSANQLEACFREGAARFGWGGWVGTGEGTSAGTEAGAEAGTEAGAEAGTEGYTGDERVRRLGGGAGNFPVGGPPHAPNDSPLPSLPHNIRRGVGVAGAVWGAGGGPPAYATVRLNSDGTIDVLSGTQDLGTGSRTILAQIAAESLGAKLEDVRVVLGDTERTPYAGTSWGSMTTASVGPAVRSASVEAQKRLLEAAGELLECHPDDLVAQESVIETRDRARRMTFGEVTRKLGNVMIMGNGSRGPNPQDVGLASFAAQFAEVEVDVDTGVVRVLRLTGAHDAGRVINPLLASSQLEGGMLQGMGFALFEENRLDPRNGRSLNPGLHDYKIPTLADTPRIDAFCIESVDPTANHIGARGLAEPPIIPTAPAIANAVADALGVEVDAVPLTPWRVLPLVRR